MKQEEIRGLKNYLNKLFDGNVEVRERTEVHDGEGSAEVYRGKEFLGLIYRDDDDGDEVSYALQMTILAQDLAD